MSEIVVAVFALCGAVLGVIGVDRLATWLRDREEDDAALDEPHEIG